MGWMQRAVKEFGFRENFKQFKMEKGMLQVPAQSKDHAAQAPVGNLIIHAAVLVDPAGCQEDKGSRELVYSVGCCLCSSELHLRIVARGLIFAGGRLNSGKSPFAAQLQTTGSPANMVRPRQRLLSRRGSTRGGSSHHPGEESHHHCCCCYCHRRTGASTIQASQYMEMGNTSVGKHSLPAFGSTIFTLGSSRDNSRINAHISVLFTEDSQEYEDGLDGKEELPGEQPGKAKKDPEGVPEQTPKRPQEQEASNSKRDTGEEWDGFPEHYGWCRIIGEKPED